MKRNVHEMVRMATVVGLVALLSPVSASGEVCIPEAGAWPFGPVRAVAAAGPLAYYGSGAALVVADVSDSELPRVLGSAPLPGVVREIAIEGERVVVAAYRAGLRVLDVSDPATPTEVGSFEAEPDDTFWDVAGSGDHVHFGNGVVSASGGRLLVSLGGGLGRNRGGLMVVDVSDPSSPEAVEVDVDLYLGDGTLLGRRTHVLPPFSYLQETNVFGFVTEEHVPGGFAVVRSDTPGALFLAWASVVDNRSGDPTLIPAARSGAR